MTAFSACLVSLSQPERGSRPLRPRLRTAKRKEKRRRALIFVLGWIKEWIG